MLRKFLRTFSFLMVSLLLVSCASQKSISPFNTAEVNPELNSGQRTRKADNLIVEKPISAPPSQPVEVEKEVKPVKETGAALEQTPVSKAVPVPEKVSVILNVHFDTGEASIKPKYQNDIITSAIKHDIQIHGMPVFLTSVDWALTYLVASVINCRSNIFSLDVR